MDEVRTYGQHLSETHPVICWQTESNKDLKVRNGEIKIDFEHERNIYIEQKMTKYTMLKKELKTETKGVPQGCSQDLLSASPPNATSPSQNVFYRHEKKVNFQII